ncbi:MAG: beta-glucoside-specific PTS transporter subunit IIABC [Oscillospiraceae bacterium]|jgi:PTS system beta-glucosides-specific IIC component|nr:beta-glucoside-specific PTS transporter subunit IIABC [Oscillospiraceae bacterium]
MNYAKTAAEILRGVGGEKNVSSMTHCMTRLRLILKDDQVPKDSEMLKIPGVLRTVRQGGQYQIVIGSQVSHIYDELQKLGNFTAASTDEEAPKSAQKENILSRLFGFIAGCMTPLLPALMGGGMLKVLITLLTALGWISTKGSTYAVLNIMGDAPFYFLPIMLAYTCARRVSVNPILAMCIAGVMLHPNLAALFKAGQAVTFLKLPVTATTYSGSVIPILMMIPLMKYIERFAEKISPDMVKVFLKPMLVLLISAPVALIVVGPLGGIIGGWLATGVTFLYTHAGWLTIMLLAAVFPFIVMTGMHYALFPIALNSIAAMGYDPILMVIMFCSNLAQGAACFGVAVRTKNKTMRQTASAAGVTAIVAGVTEPALYGVTLKLKRPLATACIGSGIAGLFCGIVGARVFAFNATSNVFTLITMIGGGSMKYLIYGLIAMAIALIVSFVGTLLAVRMDDPDMQPETAEETSEAEAAPACKEQPALENKEAQPLQKKFQLSSPLSGYVVPLEKVNDETFASGVMGSGVGIQPADGRVYAPADGTIDCLMDTNHAIGMHTDSGADVLIHIGKDTVNLQGRFFTPHIKTGDTVKQGDLLLECDLAGIRKAGYDTISPVTVTNSADYLEVLSHPEGEVKAGEKLITVLQ